MRVLILNWKDIRHPAMGGAEVLTHAVAERLASWGHEVTLFAPAFPGSEPEQVIRGVRVLRRGNRLTVYWHAFRYARKYAHEFDRIIDQINTLPFWTPLYLPESKRMMLIHQLAREVWFYELPKVLAWVGYVIEPWLLKVYRSERTITVSESTRHDLIQLGFQPERVKIMPEGVDIAPVPDLDTKPDPVTFLFAGRLTPMKRVDHIIEAFRLVKAHIPSAQLSLVGSGPNSYVEQLKRQAAGIEGVVFHGRVSQEEKRRLMMDATVVVGASVREGWGLFISEAAALGTPSAVYDVPGLRDSTRNGITGLVSNACTPDSLAEAMQLVVGNPVQYSRLRRAAWEWARTLTWDNAAAVVEQYLHEDAWQEDVTCRNAVSGG